MRRDELQDAEQKRPKGIKNGPGRPKGGSLRLGNHGRDDKNGGGGLRKEAQGKHRLHAAHYGVRVGSPREKSGWARVGTSSLRYL